MLILIFLSASPSRQQCILISLQLSQCSFNCVKLDNTTVDKLSAPPTAKPTLSHQDPTKQRRVATTHIKKTGLIVHSPFQQMLNTPSKPTGPSAPNKSILVLRHNEGSNRLTVECEIIRFSVCLKRRHNVAEYISQGKWLQSFEALIENAWPTFISYLDFEAVETKQLFLAVRML